MRLNSNHKDDSMAGIVSWEQLIFITVVILAVAGSMFSIAWRAQSIRARDRHDQRSMFQQEIVSVHELINIVRNDLDSRLRTIEMSNAGTLVMLKHMDEFKKEVMDRFESLNSTRRHDMEVLNRRLDAVHNAARLITIDKTD